MAKAGKTEAAPPAAAPVKTGGKKKLVLLLLALTLFTGLSGGGAWFYLMRAKAAQELAEASEEDGSSKAEAKPGAKGDAKSDAKGEKGRSAPPVFVTLEPFTVNLQETEAQRYLQVGVVLEASDKGAVDAINLYMPMIRNRILLLLSSKRAAELETPDGKQRLAEEIVDAARAPLGGRGRAKTVEGVYFASFVIQ
jgi:flagellar FliL protein